MDVHLQHQLLFSIDPQLPPTTPTISTTAPTCSSAGVSTITNYSASNIYTFTPVGPTVGAGGVISGMTVGTSYTVTADNGICLTLNQLVLAMRHNYRHLQFLQLQQPQRIVHQQEYQQLQITTLRIRIHSHQLDQQLELEELFQV